MDVLPAQASSVSSERVFSSSKLTCTQTRNKIGTRTVESLQILKYSLRQQRNCSKRTNVDNLSSNDKSSQGGLQKLDLMAPLADDDWYCDVITDADCGD